MTGRLTRWLVRSAAGTLPAPFVDRYEEEWLAELEAAGADRPLAAMAFAVSVQLSAHRMRGPLELMSRRPETASGDAADAAAWVTDPAVVAEALRRVLERHAAPPKWHEVLATMRDETAGHDDELHAELDRSLETLLSVLDGERSAVAVRLRAARQEPLGRPAARWPRADSLLQLWQVANVDRLKQEHFENELNWLIDSELRQARYSFGAVQLPPTMLDAMREAGRQAVAEALSRWPTTSPSNLDNYLRAAVRQAFSLHVVNDADRADGEIGERERRAS